jgi:hypothetical protein
VDKIYEGALATIVAAAGEDSDYGLPRISRARETQQTAAFNGLALVASLPRLPAILAKSKWATRGWTYQEAVLSRRCIFFTTHQVYFVCRETTYCEAIRFTGQELNNPRTTPRLHRLRADVFDGNSTSSSRSATGLWDFFDHLYHYKRRTLSYIATVSMHFMESWQSFRILPSTECPLP